MKPTRPLPKAAARLAEHIPEIREGAEDPLVEWFDEHRRWTYQRARRQWHLLVLVFAALVPFAALALTMMDVLSSFWMILFAIPSVVVPLTRLIIKSAPIPAGMPCLLWSDLGALVAAGTPRIWHSWTLIPLTGKRAAAIVAYQRARQKFGTLSLLGVWLSLFFGAYASGIAYWLLRPDLSGLSLTLLVGLVLVVVTGASVGQLMKAYPLLLPVEMVWVVSSDARVLARRARTHPEGMGALGDVPPPSPSIKGLLGVIAIGIAGVVLPFFTILLTFFVGTAGALLGVLGAGILAVGYGYTLMKLAPRYEARYIARLRETLADYEATWAACWPILSGPLPEEE
ncbi:MAG: hypothetical protein RLY93_17090 [Sumerlaeia bacterium]